MVRLAYEVRNRGLEVVERQPIPIVYAIQLTWLFAAAWL